MEPAISSGMCRCCASEGSFKDLKTAYQWMGDEEVYSEMLRECFDISLFTNIEGEVEGGICEVCITHLRSAANFKKQVLDTEEQLKLRIHEGKLYKNDIVKQEVGADDENDSDNDHNISEDFSGTEYDVPIKMETEEPKPKKRAAKASTSCAKRTKTDDGETSKRTVRETSKIIKIRPNISTTIKIKQMRAADRMKLKDMIKTFGSNLKAVKKITSIKDSADDAKSTPRTLEKSTPTMPDSDEDLLSSTEKDKHLHNIRTILRHSNITPIHSRKFCDYFTCWFCNANYSDPLDLKDHILSTHRDDYDTFMEQIPPSEYRVKVDTTGLQCNICSDTFEKLDLFVKHLGSHGKKIYPTLKNFILPFKCANNIFYCEFCSQSFTRFKVIVEHMALHIQNFICNVCYASFVTRKQHLNHTKRHAAGGEYLCSICAKVFNSMQAKRNHELLHTLRFESCKTADHSNAKFKCPYCDTRFGTYTERMAHMVKEHNDYAVEHPCRSCDKRFLLRKDLCRHKRKAHVHACNLCHMKFLEYSHLKRHLESTHSSTRKYQCDTCQKSYTRKHSLREHMGTHLNDLRFKCLICGQIFLQKQTWKSHIKNLHGDIAQK